ncbi:MAG TPA: HD domain-containing phosphohydrolase, partial [Burkholderiales bacterium]|nr:HD domain-containing phosphohydrolase [Burkholderiales bacterium]
MSDTKPTILAIDDAEGVRRLLEVTLGKSQVVKTAPDAHSALAWAQLATPPDLVLLDTEPAGMSGYELCKALRAMPGFTEVPVVFLAERRDPPGVVQGFQLGAIDFLVKPLTAPLLLQRIRGHLEQLARERTAGTQGAELRIGRLVRAMQLYERSLGGNRAKRLAQYARVLAQAAGAREGAADLLAKAAPVHDVGKLAVPPELLHNERALAGTEREQFERHAALGAEIIGEHEDALLKLARTLALTHHEFWDGSGYPGRLQGNQIPSAGRVMAIVDAFESMTAAQYGGSRMSTEAAVAEIVAGAGLQFDPALVEALRKAAAEFRKVHGAYPERAADAGDDLMIGAQSARLPAAKPAQPAAHADDLVLGAPARDPSDDAGLTMMGPLRLGGAAAASSDKIREAIQRAAAKAQRPAAPPPPPPAPAPDPAPAPPIVEKPAAAPLDLQLEATAPAAIVAAALAQARPQAPGELEQLRGELQMRMNELEATRAALVEARAQHAGVEALNSRIATLVSERAAVDAALAQARAEVERVHGELAELRNKPVTVVDPQTQPEIASLRNRVTELEGEHSTAVAALLQERAEAERARSELTELRQRPAAADRVSQLESELQQAHAQISHSSAAAKQLEGELSRAQGELADLRNKPAQTEDSQSPAEIARLHSRINDVETARAAAAAALAEAHAGRGQERAEMTSLRERVRELEAERGGVAALLAQARSESERGTAELRTLRARLNELEAEHGAADAAAQGRDAEAAQAESRLAEIESALLELERKRE